VFVAWVCPSGPALSLYTCAGAQCHGDLVASSGCMLGDSRQGPRNLWRESGADAGWAGCPARSFSPRHLCNPIQRLLGGRFHDRIGSDLMTGLHAQQPGKLHAGSIDPALDGAFGYALDGCDLLICHALGTDQQNLPLPARQVDQSRTKQKSP
jgi:hypothetical protein